MNIVAVVQARMGSARLPNKAMLHFNGYPIVEWVYRRLKQSQYLNNIVFAVPETKENIVLTRHLEHLGAAVFIGSENDVVDRFVKAADSYDATHVVRVCADNPLVSASEIDRLISYYLNNDCDYVYNHIPRNNCYPDGLGAEICNIELLRTIDKEGKTASQREHVLNYIWDNSERFTIDTFDPPEALQYPELKLDVDTIEDYEKLLGEAYEITMSADEIVDIALRSEKGEK